MAGIILWIIAGIVFLAAIVGALCDKNGNEAPIIGGGMGITAFLLLWVLCVSLATNLDITDKQLTQISMIPTRAMPLLIQ